MEMNQSTEPLVDAVAAGPITVVSIRTPMLTDSLSIAAVVNEVREISRRSEPPNILLNFHRVAHVSLDFLDEMTGVTEEIKMRGGSICCCSLSREMRSVLKTLGAHVLYAGHSVQHAVMRHRNWLERQRRAGTRSGAS
ncbi:MAG: hypothetical protein IT365_18600 [Candidatus Hydrogenedentes bacterium]|nr:hypothetical protein [Candidatus Hydrogenedentota bacterium]